MEQFEKRISTAFAKLALREAFIAAAVTRVQRHLGDYNGRVLTAATDGENFWFNPEFCGKLSDEELFGVVVHEALHVVLMHMWRRGDRHPGLWNEANDAIINNYIKSRGYVLPAKHIHIKWVTEQMDSEEVYARLKKEQQEDKKDGTGGGGGFGTLDDEGDFAPGSEGDLIDAPSESRRSDMEATIAAAAQMAKAAGDKSSIIDRILRSTGKPKVAWQDETRAMLTSSAASDYSYRRPSRRFITQGLYLPSLWAESLGGLAIAIDTSGSMGPEELNQIAAEVTQIAEDLRPEFIVVVYCDTRINKVQRFERDDEISLVGVGGGGTRFKPVFDYLKEIDNLAGMVYFTDMCGDLSECTDPGMPVIWAYTGPSNVGIKQPFGVLAHVKI